MHKTTLTLFAALAFSNISFAQESYLSSSDIDRNGLGQCDSTCQIMQLPPMNFEQVKTEWTLNNATTETQVRNLTCEEGGYPPEYVGAISQKRTYAVQNGSPIPGSYGPWSTVTNTCAAPLPCVSQNVAWRAEGSTCSGTISTIASGSNTSTINNRANYIGRAVFSCKNGQWSFETGSCSYSTPTCSATNLSWTSSGLTCSGSVSATEYGQAKIVSNNSATKTGSASFSCREGTWIFTSGSCAPTRPEPVPTPPPVTPEVPSRPTTPVGPPAGTPFSVDSFICDERSSLWNYRSDKLDSYFKYQLLIEYTRHPNLNGKCPDAGGWKYWLDEVITNGNAKGGTKQAYIDAYVQITGPNIRWSHNQRTAEQNLLLANTQCTTEAQKLYGPSRTATYVPRSGNRCMLQ